MNILWQISVRDAARIKEIVGQQAQNQFVRKRRLKNLAKTKPRVTRAAFWACMVKMRLTSVQKSGPNSHVNKFNKSKPFPLNYKSLCAAKKPKAFIAHTLKEAGGIRFVPTIADQLVSNFTNLENGEWGPTLERCNRLLRSDSATEEKEVADYINDNFLGFGPKQSRNLLQELGLTRYEIPIDSRITKWLNEFRFPVRLNASALADRHYYNFVSKGIQMLCAKANVYPCILDASIFSMKDGDGWTTENV